MVHKLIVLVLIVAVVFVMWTLSVVGALAEAWAKMPPPPTAENGAPSLTLVQCLGDLSGSRRESALYPNLV